MELITNFLLQVLFSFGIIFLFGFIVYICNKIFYKNFGRLGHKVCLITGFLGTPIHECSHALCCLIFGHKIVDMKLFQIDDDEGTLGYVQHSYNSKNIYHQIGNFFIGVAPILVISLLLYFLESLILPEISSQVYAISNRNIGSVGDFLKNVLDIVKVLFSDLGNPMWWVFMILGMFFALHMNLSHSDIKGALKGLLILLIFLLAIDLVLFIVNKNILFSLTEAFGRLGSCLISVFVVSLTLSLIALLISLIVRLFFGKHL